MSETELPERPRRMHKLFDRFSILDLAAVGSWFVAMVLIATSFVTVSFSEAPFWVAEVLGVMGLWFGALGAALIGAVWIVEKQHQRNLAEVECEREAMLAEIAAATAASKKPRATRAKKKSGELES